MKESLLTKLDTILERHEELASLLESADILHQPMKLRDLSKEYADISILVTKYREYKDMLIQLNQLTEMLADQELKYLAEQEITVIKANIPLVEQELQAMLLPQDPNDNKNLFLEIRAGTGGDEAAIFVGDLYRMYTRYAEKSKWQTEIISASYGEHGGFKEIIVRIVGQNAYAQLKFESGTHRVQRVPTTEAQGRIHTSAVTVAVLPEADIVDIKIDTADLRIDTYRASGAGGQHVNRTDSAIRITHLPSGLVVECQDERSQHKNRARAMAVLQSRLLSMQQEKARQEKALMRKLQVGSGDRSERIRTYNFPQGRLTDHRINLTLYKLEDIIEGNLLELIQALRTEHQAELLAEMNSN